MSFLVLKKKLSLAQDHCRMTLGVDHHNYNKQLFAWCHACGFYGNLVSFA